MDTPTEQFLSDQTREAIQTARLLVRRDAALVSLSNLLNGDGELSTWGLAGRVSAELKRFRAVAWQRLQAGYRAPKNDFEQCLFDICESDCPVSQRRLFDLLVDLRL
jgi:hypothetical protein